MFLMLADILEQMKEDEEEEQGPVLTSDGKND